MNSGRHRRAVQSPPAGKGLERRKIVFLAISGALALITACAVAHQQASDAQSSGPLAASQASASARSVVPRQIDGGPHYYAMISPHSTWMDQHILLGGWDEMPTSAADVAYDRAMGNNIYWSLAGEPAAAGCAYLCRVDYGAIRVGGMHVVAPDITAESGSETVGYQGNDESDLKYGPGSDGWNRASSQQTSSACIPSGSQCGFSVAKDFYTSKPPAYGDAAQLPRRLPVNQGYSRAVLFWETNAQAAKFLSYTDILSADTYWMTDPSLADATQGACALLPQSVACGDGNGPGLTTAQRALPANYAYNITRIRQIEAEDGQSKPIVADIETGCPVQHGACTTPAAARAAAWHSLIAGARGILWFQHNFSGPCVDYRTLYDGSDPASSLYDCQQTPGVTLHDVVTKIAAVNHQIDSLNDVLLSPSAENYVNVGHADVSVMAKDSNGTFYVFAAAGKPADPPPANQSIAFKLADSYTGTVTVVGEARTLRAVNGTFADRFANEDTVHIYRIGG
jgi:hypothetical protein